MPRVQSPRRPFSLPDTQNPRSVSERMPQAFSNSHTTHDRQRWIEPK